MAPDALRMLARQLRRDPNPDAIEDAACALEALAIGQERQARRVAVSRWGDSLSGRPFVSRPPGALRATMRASENDLDAREDVHRRPAAS